MLCKAAGFVQDAALPDEADLPLDVRGAGAVVLVEGIDADLFFGADAVPASSLKGHLGHTLGASGVIETIAALEMMNRGILLPTLNLESVAEECSGVDHVRTPREHKVDVFLKNSFAFGGINAALICVANEQ